MTILMCPPRYYATEYEINPWMHLEVPVDGELAASQWERLRRTFVELGEQVELADPLPGLPDMVFSANAGVVWNGRMVASRFRHAERRGEEGPWVRAVQRLGIEVAELPSTLVFEGAGDALFVGERLFCGFGFRSDRDSHAEVGRLLGVDVVSVELVDPRFYHLDTCFCPLNDRSVLFAPDAFTRESAQVIRRLVPHVIEVPLAVALGFACNALVVGHRVISSQAAGRLRDPLRSAGFETVGLPVGEFIKSGGGVRCLSLPLDPGLATAA